MFMTKNKAHRECFIARKFWSRNQDIFQDMKFLSVENWKAFFSKTERKAMKNVDMAVQENKYKKKCIGNRSTFYSLESQIQV